VTKEQAHNRKIQLFTNGIELKQYLSQLEDVQILINYNNPKNLTNDQFNKLQDTLETAFQNYSNVTIGCNIYLDCENYDYIWDIVSKYNLKKIRYHDLRHSCATLLRHEGVPMEDIQKWLGHSQITITNKLYAHFQYDAHIRSADKIGKALEM
jgi:hypothetical protein